MKKFSILIVLSNLFLSNPFCQFRTGAIIDEKLYIKTPIISPVLKFNDPIRYNSYSLKKYCPKPQNQGAIGSCTGWAAGYAGLTIAESILDEIQDIEDITTNARSALYIYNQLKTCDKGANLPYVFDLIKKNGACLKNDFNPKSCMILPDENTIKKAKEIRIKEYTRIWNFNESDQNKINNAKRTLIQKRPVVIAMKTTKSLQSIPKSGLYTPKDTEKHSGNHAVCLIGFDDSKKEFELMNSWGSNWGNNGFFSMSYDDFAKYAYEGYQFSIERSNSTRNFSIYGNFELLKYFPNSKSQEQYLFNTVMTRLDDNFFYNLNEPIKKDDFFRLRCMNLKNDTYVYLLTYKPDRSVEILFPLNYSNKEINDIALIPQNSTSFELPVNVDNGYTVDIPGNDYLIILFSSSPIDNLGEFTKNIKNYGDNLWEWIRQSFPDRFVSPDLVNYSKNIMGINSNLKYGTIVPIVLKAKII